MGKLSQKALDRLADGKNIYILLGDEEERTSCEPLNTIPNEDELVGLVHKETGECFSTYLEIHSINHLWAEVPGKDGEVRDEEDEPPRRLVAFDDWHIVSLTPVWELKEPVRKRRAPRKKAAPQQSRPQVA